MDFKTKTMMPNSDKSRIYERRITKKPVLYPEFLDASEILSDPCWKDILMSAARGDFGNKNITYEGGFLIWKPTGAKNRVPKENNGGIIKAFKYFYRKYARIVSNDEIEVQKLRERLAMDREIILTWTTCNKSLQHSRLSDYASRSVYILGCPNPVDSEKDLSSILLLAYGNKMLTEKTVTMSNNLIDNITCIKYNKKSRCWWIDRTAL